MLEAAGQREVVASDLLRHLDGRSDFVDHSVGDIMSEAMVGFQSISQAALDGIGAELVAHRIAVAATLRIREMWEKAVKSSAFHILDER